MWQINFWLPLVCMSLSCVAAVMAVWSSVRAREMLSDVSASSLTTLQLDLMELKSQYESLHAAHARLVSRVSMREIRERRRPNGEAVEENVQAITDRGKLREIARSKGLLRG